MFKLNENQLEWKELIRNNDRVLIYADRCTGKTTAMRTILGNVVMFVNTDHEARQYQCKKSNIKTRVFGESPCGLHPDIVVFDDITINKYNFEMFKHYFPMSKSKIIVIGTFHYWKVACLFDKIGVVYESK